jgi:hypothetical protein
MQAISRRRGLAGVPFWLVALFAGSAALGAWFLIRPALASGRYYTVGYNRSTFEYSPQIILLFVPYAFALWAWRRGSRVSARVLLGGAIILHALVLLAPLPQSQDFYQYLFYGKMQAVHHANPYVTHPSVFWADRWLAWTSWRWHDQTSVYGPVWMLVSFGVVKAAGDSLGLAFVLLKLVIFAVDVGVMATIAWSGGRNRDASDRAGWGLLVFAWNPMVLVTVPLAGAVDIVVAGCFIGAILARRRGRVGLASFLLAVAALTKVYAAAALLLHLVLIGRERGWVRAARHGGAVALLAAAAYAPYWAGFATFRGVLEATGLTNLTLAGTVQMLVVSSLRGAGIRPPGFTPGLIHALFACGLVAVVVWAIRRVRSERELWYATLVVCAAYLYLTPWFLSWYGIGALALVAVLPSNPLSLPVIAFSATSMAAPWTLKRPAEWLGTSLIRYVPPVAILLRGRLRPGRRAVPSPGSAGPVVTIPIPSTAALVRSEPAAK